MKNVISSAVIAIAACAVVSSAAPSAAAPAAPAAAQSDLVEGRALRAKGDLAGARARFESAWKAQKSAVVGYELGSVLRALGLLTDAYDVLFEVRELKPSRAEEIAAQRDAAKLFVEVDAAIPMVILELGALGDEVAKVLIDDVPLPRAEWAEAQPLDPGKHEIVVVLRDGSGLKKAITVGERARARVKFALPAGEPASAPIAAAPTPKPPLSCPEGAVVRDTRCVRLVRYGVPLAIADALTTGIFVVGILTVPDRKYNEFGDRVDDGPPMVLLVGGLSYPFASPIVHWAHKRVGRGFGSFGLHAGAMLGAIITIAALDEPRRSVTSAIAGAAWGAIGFGLDHLIIPHDAEIPVAEASASAISKPMFGVAPVRGGAAASLQFTF